MGVDGMAGNALKFENTLPQYVALPDNLIANDDTFTISAWVKTPGSISNQRIYAEGSSINNQPVYYLGISPQGSPFIYANGAGTGDALKVEASSSNIVNDGYWHYVTGVRTGSHSAKIYIDGQEVSGYDSGSLYGTPVSEFFD